MNKEIKEIIDRMQELVKHKYDKEIHTYNLFDDIQELLDYITNLEQENERLKIEKQDYKESFNIMAKFRDKALTREWDYKSRNEKAIEYNKEVLTWWTNEDITTEIAETNLRILNGGD